MMTNSEASLSEVTVRIFDLSGRIVRTFKSPDNLITWEGDTDAGELLESGIYFLLPRD